MRRRNLNPVRMPVSPLVHRDQKAPQHSPRRFHFKMIPRPAPRRARPRGYFAAIQAIRARRGPPRRRRAPASSSRAGGRCVVARFVVLDHCKPWSSSLQTGADAKQSMLVVQCSHSLRAHDSNQWSFRRCWRVAEACCQRDKASAFCHLAAAGHEERTRSDLGGGASSPVVQGNVGGLTSCGLEGEIGTAIAWNIFCDPAHSPQGNARKS